MPLAPRRYNRHDIMADQDSVTHEEPIKTYLEMLKRPSRSEVSLLSLLSALSIHNKSKQSLINNSFLYKIKAHFTSQGEFFSFKINISLLI